MTQMTACNGASHKHRMQRIIRHHIGGITPLAGNKAEIFAAAHLGVQFFAVHTSLKHYTQGAKKP